MTRRVTSNEEIDEDARAGNPSGESPEHLAGDLGVSSERQAPFEGIDGTGSAGTAVDHTDGTLETHPEVTGSQQPGATPHPQDPAEGPDEPAHDEPGQNGDAPRVHPEDPAEGADDESTTGVDRTVGESNTAEVPSQPFDRARNPGHSHG